MIFQQALHGCLFNAINRQAIAGLEVDLVSQDLLVGATAELEKFQWFMRSHFLAN